LSDQPESDDKRFPVGKVLVQRSDADSRDLGHPVGDKASQRLFGQNASSRFKTESQTRTPCRQVHGHRQAFVVNPGACAGCGDCINQCPEHAINLNRNPGAAPSADAQELE
jgi:NAD-dependent dihydropyrimidine dehydrogenase PreA subunit